MVMHLFPISSQPVEVGSISMYIPIFRELGANPQGIQYFDRAIRQTEVFDIPLSNLPIPYLNINMTKEARFTGLPPCSLTCLEAGKIGARPVRKYRPKPVDECG